MLSLNPTRSERAPLAPRCNSDCLDPEGHATHIPPRNRISGDKGCPWDMTAGRIPSPGRRNRQREGALWRRGSEGGTGEAREGLAEGITLGLQLV